MISRPWTVYLLVVASLASLVFGQVVDAERNLWDAVSVAFTVFVAWGLWTGRTWAFSMSFMFAALCAALALGAALVQVFLMELDVTMGLLWAGAIAIFWVTLLMLPATKRFAGLDQPHETAGA
jgi:hypothetical protein